MMASAKANQVEPFAYLRDVIIRISDNEVGDVAALLPDGWHTSHPEHHRQWSR